MSVYVHVEHDPQVHTERFDAASGPFAVSDVKRKFIEKHRAKYSSGSFLANADLAAIHLKPLGSDVTLKDGDVLHEVCGNGADVMLIHVPPPPPPAKPSRPTKASEEVTVFEAIQAAENFVKEKQYAKAQSIFHQLLDAVPGDARHHLHAKMASTYALSGQLDKSIKCYEDAVEGGTRVGVECSEIKVLLGKTLYEACQYKRAMEVLGTVASTMHNTREFLLYYGAANYWAGNKKLGADLVSGVLKADAEYLDGLVEYCRIYSDQGIHLDAMSLAIRILVTNSQNDKLRQHFADTFRADPNGLRTLRQCLGGGDRSPEAAKGLAEGIGFLSNVLKDHSETEVAASMYLLCCDLMHGDSNYALNYIHTLEIDLKYGQALAFAVDFLRSYGTQSVMDVTSADVAEVVTSGPNSARIMEVTRVSQPRTTLSPATLSLLAIYMTLVKITFVSGDVDRSRALVRLVRHVPKNQELHTTTIRNEAAYFSCISELVETLPPAEVVTQCSECVYLCGDSHSLSPSWRVLREGKCLIRNALVTGLKCWHLRDATDFYPKKNFWAVIKSIPDCSRVIMLFGEIDCREGIIRAVEKGVYADVVEGMKFILDIYFGVLDHLRKVRKFDICIHPPMPTIDVTRHLVLQFAVLLQLRARSEGYKFLDVLPDMCEVGTDGKQRLRECYNLDGVHVNPCYLEVLEGQLRKCYP